MPSNSNGLIEINDKIEKIRKWFFDRHPEHFELYDECDVQRVKQNDGFIKRFLLSNKLNEELALKNITETLEWRKSFGVNTRTDDYFPDDFYKIGGLFIYQCDKEGLPLLYLRVGIHHKVKELSQYIKEYFVHYVNKIDSFSDGQWAIVFDSANSGLSNVDMDFSRFMIHVLQNHFPKGYKYVLIYEMPWIMVAFWKITRGWLSEEVKQLIKFANGPQLFDFVDAENVPEYITGGKCAKSIHNIPEGVKPAEQLPHLNFTAEQIQRFRNIFNIKSEDKPTEENGN